MRNDNRNVKDLPIIRRSIVSVAVAVVALATAIVSGVVASMSAMAAITGALAGEVVAKVPVDDQAVATLADSWKSPVESAGTSFVDVFVTGLPAEVSGSFVLAHAVELVVALILCVTVVIASLGLLSGRLRWELLSWLTIVGGAVMSVGSLIVQALFTTSAEGLSIWLQPADSDWAEPGFLAGMDFTPIAAGLVIFALGLAFRSTARHAHQADGVV